MKVKRLFVNVLLFSLFLTCSGIPSQAQEVLVLYENFEAKLIDPNKWYGVETASSGVVVLESGRQIKTEPTFSYKGLDLLNRAFANTTTDAGSSGASTGLYFNDGVTIRSIQATVQVKKIQITTCSSNPTTVSESRARIGGAFFNTGTPTPGSYLNDVFALIALNRRSDSTSPADTLDVIGKAAICNDANCNSTTLIEQVDLGTAKVNQKVKLRITWDPDNNRFIFQKGKGAESYISYTVSDTQSPGAPNGGSKRLQVHHSAIPNCTTDPQPFGHVDAFFDNIYVNASALP